MHAAHVLADAGERLTKWRIDDTAHQIEADCQHHQHVDIVCMAVEVVIEHAEQRIEDQARQTVIAAGDIGAQIARLLKHGGKRDGQHQQRQAPVAEDEPANQTADRPRQQPTGDDAADRLTPAEPQGGKRDGIGPDAEKCGMTERYDTGVTQDQIEREREYDHYQHLAAKGHAVGKSEVAGNRDQPRQRFRPAEIMSPDEKVGRPRAPFVGGHIAGHGLIHGHRTPPA